MVDGVGNGKRMMNVTVRRLEKHDHEYIGYGKSLCRKASCFRYRTDGLFGAIALCDFVEMLKKYFKAETLRFTVHEHAFSRFARLKGTEYERG